MDYVKEHKDVVDMLLEMRLCKGSECLLTPYYGYDYVCSVEILRTLIDPSEEYKWINAVNDIWKIWSNLKDHKG